MTDDHANLPIWTVYDHPRDYPNGYVARRWLTLPVPRATNEVIIADKLDDIRDQLEAKGLVKLMRDPSDEPQIVETWL